jgi:cytochrome P450
MAGYSPFEDATLSDHAARYDRLRAGGPVSLFEGYDPHFHILHAYDDIEAALRNIEVFSSDQGQGPRYTPPSGMVCDPPLHSLHRGLVQQAFTPGAIRAMTPRVEATPSTGARRSTSTTTSPFPCRW